MDGLIRRDERGGDSIRMGFISYHGIVRLDEQGPLEVSVSFREGVLSHCDEPGVEEGSHRFCGGALVPQIRRTVERLLGSLDVA